MLNKVWHERCIRCYVKKPAGCELEQAYQQSWTVKRRTKTMGGTASCSSSLLKARLVGSRLKRQSVDRLPLVREEKAKLQVLKTQ